MSDATDTSHSRTNDSLAVQLRQNVEHAFAVETVTNFRQLTGLTRGTNHIEIAPERHAVSADDFSVRAAAQFAARQSADRRRRRAGQQIVFRPAAFGEQFGILRHMSQSALRVFAAAKVSRGVDGDLGTRNAMSLENLAWKDSFFWDGRAATLREQVLQPIQNPIEMHESLTKRRRQNFRRTRIITGCSPMPSVRRKSHSDRIARALEQFLLVQVSFDSKFDRVMNGTAKFTEEEARGFVLFNTEYDPYHGQFGADCFHCHGGPLFQSQDFANNGLDSTFRDLGRYNVTKRDGDKGKFAVPSLRNVAVTGPYMHDGRFQTLERGRRALLHRHETQRDARSESRQASRRRRAVERRRQKGVGRISENAYG